MVDVEKRSEGLQIDYNHNEKYAMCASPMLVRLLAMSSRITSQAAADIARSERDTAQMRAAESASMAEAREESMQAKGAELDSLRAERGASARRRLVTRALQRLCAGPHNIP